MRTDPVPSGSIGGHSLGNFLKSFIRNELGAAAAEYALILASIGVGIAMAGKDLATAISLAFNTVQGYF